MHYITSKGLFNVDKFSVFNVHPAAMLIRVYPSVVFHVIKIRHCQELPSANHLRHFTARGMNLSPSFFRATCGVPAVASNFATEGASVGILRPDKLTVLAVNV